MSGLTNFHKECQELMSVDAKLFPVEIDFDQSTCKPKPLEMDENDVFEEENTEDLIQDIDQSATEINSQLAQSAETETNLLDISDSIGQSEHIPASNGDIEQLIEDPSIPADGGTWNENWLLGPDHEQSVPQNIEPGGDIDLLLLDN